MASAVPLPSRCPERERLLDLLKAANHELVEIHAAEMAAAILGNLDGFNALQDRLAIARDRRDEVAIDLKQHMQEHGC